MLAYGPANGLDHARKAVEDARWGLENFGDQAVGEKLLAVAERTYQEVLEGYEVEDTGSAGNEDGSAHTTAVDDEETE